MPEPEKKGQEKKKKSTARQIIEAITSGGFTVLIEEGQSKERKA